MSTAEIVRDWHPLDGVPAPEYIPPFWDGPHVGMRLSDAMRVLSNLPTYGTCIGGYGSMWPAYQLQVEWSDLLAMTQSDPAQQAQDAAGRNRTRVTPSAIEIARMEFAIGWPGMYLIRWPQLLKRVTLCAYMRSRNLPMERAAKKLREPYRWVRRCNQEGLTRIAEGLRKQQVPVF
jgi:hypothetical protein